MAVFFLLLALIVQLGFLVIARSALSASMEAAARRAVVPDSDVGAEQERLAVEIRSVVPGIEVVATDIEQTSDQVIVSGTFDWTPPGPDLLPVRFTLVRSQARAVAP